VRQFYTERLYKTKTLPLLGIWSKNCNVNKFSTNHLDDIEKLIALWESQKVIGENISKLHIIKPRSARLEDFPEELHPFIRKALDKFGIHSLYLHQKQSWDAFQQGKNMVVVTGTASGKSLCYDLPVLDTALCQEDSCALFIFPTKALTQDQKESMTNLINGLKESDQTLEIPLTIYDGDTPQALRKNIREKSRLLYTNPDMIHRAILPHHTLWARFFRNLKFIIIDEIHIYRGVFGSNVANVIRRIKRVANFYSAHPLFILTSATIANPRQLAEKLIEEDVLIIDQDGSPRDEQYFIFYNPPITQPELGIRANPMVEGDRLAGDLLAYAIQTIIFARSRRSVEFMLKYLTLHYPDQVEKIRAYRSGYLPSDRRRIERDFRERKTNIVVATNALELGIDIGGVNAIVLIGYPGTIAATRQQAGRAGRKQAKSMAILIASSFPADQFIINHPSYLLEKTAENALINPDNLLILLQHIRCAAFELPFSENDRYGGLSPEVLKDILNFLMNEGTLHLAGNRYFWREDQYPAEGVSLRATSNNRILLKSNSGERPEIIGEIDRPSSYWMVHPKAIYLHEGQTYFVENLDLEQEIASLKPVETDYYTEPLKEITVEKIGVQKQEKVVSAEIFYGEIKVTTQVKGFKRIKWDTHEVLENSPLDLPPVDLQTTAFWFALSSETVQKLRDLGQWTAEPNNYGPSWDRTRLIVRQRDNFRCRVCGRPEMGVAHHVHHIIPFKNFPSYLEANRIENLITLCPSCHKRAEEVVRIRSGLAGLSYVLGHIATILLMCDINDLGVYSEPESTLTDGQPTVAIYEQIPAGIGLSEALYEMSDNLFQLAHDHVHTCACTDGCPSCVGAPGVNGSGSKTETLTILSFLINK
jgi:DEAD/DEAH box helicase domain-containing protein